MEQWIGTDESGKGDYFGGLVVAGVMVEKRNIPKLKELGVKDSKKIPDSKVRVISERIQKICPYEIVAIGPPKYNELYSKMRNLNLILAWGHARVIENLLNKIECDTVIADKFGDKRYIEKALMTEGRQITLIQRPKAENDIAVASASMVARNKFLTELERLSTQVGFRLPKGAGLQVEITAKALIKKYGEEILDKIAKTHFKTTNKIMEYSFKDKLERLWAPWRIKYIYSPKSDECIFCKANSSKDKDSFVVYRGEKGFVIMNTFPYNTGHLMVAPYRHIGSIEELTMEEATSLFELIQKSLKVLKLKMKPNGFNIGMNIGRVAGAGVEGHIHIHIVPRWTGDVNFMPIISHTKVMAQSLEEGYELLKKGFSEI
jgi:ribonuclease HIII